MTWSYCKLESFYVCKLDGIIQAYVTCEKNAQIFCQLMQMAHDDLKAQLAMIDSDNKVVQLPVKWRGK